MGYSEFKKEVIEYFDNVTKEELKNWFENRGYNVKNKEGKRNK